MDKFTKREFNALSSEVFRIAKTITNKTINSCLISINKDKIQLSIQGSESEGYKVKCNIFFYKDRVVKASEFTNFYSVVSRISNVSYGKYLSKIFQAYANRDKSETFFEF